MPGHAHACARRPVFCMSVCLRWLYALSILTNQSKYESHPPAM